MLLRDPLKPFAELPTTVLSGGQCYVVDTEGHEHPDIAVESRKAQGVERKRDITWDRVELLR